jgi:hypothetical protein
VRVNLYHFLGGVYFGVDDVAGHGIDYPLLYFVRLQRKQVRELLESELALGVQIEGTKGQELFLLEHGGLLKVVLFKNSLVLLKIRGEGLHVG